MTERTDSRYPTRRRRVLASIGLATGVGTLSRVGGAQDGDAGIVLVQGDQCVTVSPLSGSEPVEAFYDYRIREKFASPENGGSDPGEGPYYFSVGTESLQAADTSLLFLYDGPEGLSLVIVHGNVGPEGGGGAVTFGFEGLPDGGSWVVKDDYYVDPDTGEQASSNYDRWRFDESPTVVDWTWGSNGTDGGAFRGLDGALPLTIEPAFNEDATLFGQHYEGTVQAWELLTGDRSAPERVSLDTSKPVRIENGTCDSGSGGTGVGGSGGGGSGAGTDGGNQGQEKGEKKQRKHEKKQRKHRKKERKKQKKHERKQRKHERKERKHERKEEEDEEEEEEEENDD